MNEANVSTYTTLASNSGEAFTLRSLVELMNHDTSSNLESRPLVATSSGLVITKNLDFVKMVRPD